MSEPTPRQVLYALVALGFVLVEVVLVIGAAAADLVPTWWTVTMAIASAGVLLFLAFRWRKTAAALLLSIGLFVVWTVGTLALA